MWVDKASLNNFAYYCSSLYIFWLIRSLVDPTLAAFIVCGSLQFLFLIYEFSDRRSFGIRYAEFLKHGTGHAVECLNVQAGL